MTADYPTIVNHVNKIIDQYDVALTLRQIYYRLVASQVIENHINQYKRLSRVLVKARERGDVDYTRIEDRIRTVSGGDSGYYDPEDYMALIRSIVDTAAPRFQKARWVDQPIHLEVWIEKDALSSVVSSVCDEFSVPMCVTRGYSSFTFVKDAMSRLEPRKPNIILYCGDFDPSGEDMVRDLRSRLSRYCEGYNISVDKICLTSGQIDQYDLPPAPTKTGDSRSVKFVAEHGDRAVELDALEPPVLQEILREAIDGYVYDVAWNQTLDREREDRVWIQEQVDEMLGW